jgi:hypothetical protein
MKRLKRNCPTYIQATVVEREMNEVHSKLSPRAKRPQEVKQRTTPMTTCCAKSATRLRRKLKQ